CINRPRQIIGQRRESYIHGTARTGESSIQGAVNRVDLSRPGCSLRNRNFKWFVGNRNRTLYVRDSEVSQRAAPACVDGVRSLCEIGDSCSITAAVKLVPGVMPTIIRKRTGSRERD